ncbi:alpha/beta hydrolase fold domain-containing protein [Conyzicola nivalis]|uniref:Esterase n=2 Tax=Conyzicola nivalis TaxID=1477021 RepID=A0A916SPT3_9MICO|nr:esterase [Conyzicola nivalis]
MAAPLGSYAAPACPVVSSTVAGVPVRTYGSAGPTVVWLHGGGFAAGDLDMPEADVVARELVARAGATVVSVGYRLAAFPAGLDDVVAVVGALAGPVVLGGTSAGGNLALAAALRLRDEVALAGLVLAYPYLHRVNPPAPADLTARMAQLPASVRFPPAKMTAMATFYLGPLADDPPPLAYPGSAYPGSAYPGSAYPGSAHPGAAHFAGLPPTLVIGAEYDDLLPSAQDAAARLRAAGVPVREYLETGVLHGHLNTPGLPGALRTLDEMAGFLRSL